MAIAGRPVQRGQSAIFGAVARMQASWAINKAQTEALVEQADRARHRLTTEKARVHPEAGLSEG